MPETSVQIATIAADLRKRCEPSHAVNLVFSGFAVRVESNSANLIDHLRHYHRDFVNDGATPILCIAAYESQPLRLDLPFTQKQRPAGKQLKEAYFDAQDGRIIHKVRTGMMFMFGDDAHLAVGPCEANPNQVINFIDSRFMNHMLKRGGILLHAAGVRTPDRGLALAGTSSAGKSTLALHLVAAGLDFVSNDRLIVEPNAERLHMYGLAKLPRINPGTILNNQKLAPILPDDQRTKYERMSTDELWAIEDKYDVDLEACFGPGRRTLDAPMDALLILNWRRIDAPTEIRQINLADEADLLHAVMKAPGLFAIDSNSTGTDGWTDEQYVEQLRRCAVYEIRGGVDFSRAARLCGELLNVNL